MRKIYLSLLAVMLLTHFAKAQNKIEATGNVGIGTTSPIAALDVAGFIQISGTNIAGGPPPDINYGLFPYGGVGLGIYSGAGSSNQGIGIWTNPAGVKKEVMRILSGGNVGVGTLEPLAQIDVFHPGAGSSLRVGGAALGTANDTGIDLYVNNANNVPAYARIALGVNTASVGSESGYLGFSTINSGSMSEKMRITKEGNIGIGTSVPSEKLSVNGNIRAREIKVETTNWPDYVFKPGYDLPKLTELKSYINQHQHLPNLPSAKEIEKDGLNLGEMSKLLTKKVEELTLYLIEKDAELNAQKRINNDLQQKVVSLDEQLQLIKKKLNMN